MDAAIEHTLERAGLCPGDVNAVFGLQPQENTTIDLGPQGRGCTWTDLGRILGRSDAVGSVFACAIAIASLRRGENETVMVLDPGAGSASHALILSTRGGGNGC